MLIAKVIGNIVATKKEEALTGMKLLIVEAVEGTDLGKRWVAVDLVGAGSGEYVLITHGSAARIKTKAADAPVDSVIVGIIDEYEERV